MPEGSKQTRVELEHRHLHRYGVAADAFRRQVDAAGGWTFLLESFAKHALEENQ